MRKRLERISMLMGYLRDFTVEGLPAPILGVNNEQTTNALVSKTGPQLVAAYPELSHTGNSDCYTETLQSVFFVLDKSLGATRTEVSEFEQYMGADGACRRGIDEDRAGYVGRSLLSSGRLDADDGKGCSGRVDLRRVVRVLNRGNNEIGCENIRFLQQYGLSIGLYS